MPLLGHHGLEKPNCGHNRSRAMQPKLFASAVPLFKTLFLAIIHPGFTGKGSGAWTGLQAQPGMSVPQNLGEWSTGSDARHPKLQRGAEKRCRIDLPNSMVQDKGPPALLRTGT